MPFKIYTYADPYRIHQTDFWDEIKSYPHLCASRTLVNGLMSVLPSEDIRALYCPLDAIVNDRIYRDWSKNISRRIQQYSEIGRIYDNWHVGSQIKKNGHFDSPRYEGFEHNKNEMLDAVRLFRELGIRSDSLLNVRDLNQEHKIFIRLLQLEEDTDLFAIPAIPSREELQCIFLEQAKTERDEKLEMHRERGEELSSYAQKELNVIDQMIEGAAAWDGKHLVVHGIHQFTPLQLRFLNELEKQGTQIIFLHNYLKEFEEIYRSWSYIYQQFHADIRHDTNITTYKIPFQKSGRSVAENMALLCKDGIPLNDSRIRNNYPMYEKEHVVEFDTISEYAGYVSDLFADAEQNWRNTRSGAMRIQQGRISTAPVLYHMQDVIYTANQDVDDLLQVYHPDFARNRHFLSYPIGQFFTALYSLWNAQRKEIDIDFGLLRSCMNSGILTSYSSERLLKTLINVEPMFSHITNITEFKDRFEEYKDLYPDAQTHDALQKLSLYNSNKVTAKDIADLYQAVCDLNDSARELFGDTNENEQFQFEEHFRRLRDFVNDKQGKLAGEEEKELIGKLLERLNIVQTQLGAEKREGTLADLRSGLHYFLKQKENPAPDWFVKNFEQIDGDVLLSQKQNVPGAPRKIYHFACVSDRDMNKTVNDLLPWPLSEQFIEKVYNPQDLPFQVYYTSLSERSSYMRYALFYGLYFNQCDTRISFVKRYGTETTSCYELLRLIGMKTETYASANGSSGVRITPQLPSAAVRSVNYKQEQAATMFLCPYRYLMDYVLNPKPAISGTFLIQRFFVNLLIEKTWEAWKGSTAKPLKQAIDEQARKYRPFFRFFHESEMIDIKKQAENFLANNNMSGSKANANWHRTARMLFGAAKFTYEAEHRPEAHRYSKFEELSKEEDGKISYSLMRVPSSPAKELENCMRDYLNDSVHAERVGDWCTYCPDKDICLAPYTETQE